MGTALITGAAGFIGAHLTRRLVDAGIDVHAVCRPGADVARLASGRPQLTAHVADVRDRDALRRVVETIRPDTVFHLAAAAMKAGVAPPADVAVAANVVGTVNLIDACDAVDYACLVNTGDALEYGPGPGAGRESEPCRPATVDGVTKLCATLYAAAVARQRQRPIVTLRLFSIYGPGDDPRRLVPRVVEAALTNAPVRLSRPDIARDYLYVDDVVDLYLAVAGHGERLGGEVLNAASGRVTTIAEIVTTVRDLTGSTGEARWGSYPAAPHDASTWTADLTKTLAAVPWQPRTSLEEGLRRTITAARPSP